MRLRIAVTTWSRRKVGGVETYLEAVVPARVRAGHEVCFWHEVNEPQDRQPLRLPPEAPAWCAAGALAGAAC